jgi:hypothetical protein
VKPAPTAQPAMTSSRWCAWKKRRPHALAAASMHLRWGSKRSTRGYVLGVLGLRVARCPPLAFHKAPLVCVFQRCWECPTFLTFSRWAVMGTHHSLRPETSMQLMAKAAEPALSPDGHDARADRCRIIVCAARRVGQ